MLRSYAEKCSDAEQVLFETGIYMRFSLRVRFYKWFFLDFQLKFLTLVVKFNKSHQNFNF